MDDHQIKLGPVARGARIDALDILRGVAILGILLMNIPEMGLLGEWGKPALPVAVNPDWIAFLVQDIGFAGAMRGLFTLLFGAGMIIMLRRPDAERERVALQAYYTRCFALIVLGVANFLVFMWPGEILFSYGVSGLALVAFRKAPTRMLLTAAAAMLLILTVGFTVPALNNVESLRQAEAAVAAKAAGKTPTPDQAKALEKRDAIVNAKTSPEARAKERETRTHLATLVARSAQIWYKINLDFNEGAHLWLLESVGFMLLGVALFQAGVLTGEASFATYWTLLAVGLAIGLPMRVGVDLLRWRAGFLPNSIVAWLLPATYQLSRLAMTLAWLGGLLLLIKAQVLGAVGRVLAQVGRMALTNYILQSIVTSILFYGLGFFDRFGFAQLMGITVLIWIGQTIFSVLWLKAFEMGPAEWLLRSLTYGTWRTLRRPSETLAPMPAE